MSEALRVLAIENDPEGIVLLRQHLAQAAAELGPCELIVAQTLRDGCARLRQGSLDVAFMDLRLPDVSGPEAVRLARAEAERTPLVVLTGSPEDTALAAECVKAGAQDYQVKSHLTPYGLARSIHLARARLELQQRGRTKPGQEEALARMRRLLEENASLEGSRDELSALLRQVEGQGRPASGHGNGNGAGPSGAGKAAQPPAEVDTDELSEPPLENPDLEGLITRSPTMLKQVEVCLKAAATPATVLVLGETGTGKELLARIVHRHSRRTGNFVAVNCGAVPEALIESVLFGHERGAFTGAVRSEIGLFRHAHKGTIFLDEVGDLPLAAQGVTLRVLQERVVRPVGSSREYPIDVRVIAATGVALEEAVIRRRFRDDLLYRLDVVRVMVPPLRERLEDIQPLLDAFCRRYSVLYKRPSPELTPGFLQALYDYSWPGNVRQLQNLAERLLVSNLTRCDADDARSLLGSSTPAAVRRLTAAPAPAAPSLPAQPQPGPDEPEQTLEAALEQAERAYMERILRKTGGRVNAASRMAGISRRTLLRKLIKHGLDRRQFRDGGLASKLPPEPEDEGDDELV